jgi:hypothetical protein
MHSTALNTVVAVVLFLAAHFALLVGVTTPEKFYFDEVHYVPAARQMLEPVMPAPMLNPMHPPLAKQLMALSIRGFGDGPLGWRYPSVLFGSLAVVAVYLCGLALFAAPGPAIASAVLAFLNQMLFVQSRIAMLDIFALAFGLLAIAAFLQGYRKPRPQLWFALAGAGFGLSSACKWSGLFALAVCIVITAVIRLMQGWRAEFADGNAEDWYRPEMWPDFRYYHFAACFVLLPALVYLATFVPLYGWSVADILAAQVRIFSDNTTTAIAGHTYMSVAVLAVSAAPGLVPVRQDRRRPVRSRRPARQSARAVAGAGRARRLPARLDRDAPGRCVSDPGVLFRAVAGLGLAAADARISVLLSAVRHRREPGAGLRAEARQQPALAALGLRRRRSRRLCCNAADFSRVLRNVDGGVQPADDFPELDLASRPSEMEDPGDPAPVNPVMVEMRKVDRKRLPIGGAIVAISVMMGVAPDVVSGRLGIARRWGRRRLGGVGYQRGPRHARRRRCRLGRGRRLGRGCVFGMARQDRGDHKPSGDGKTSEMCFHESILSRSFRMHPMRALARREMIPGIDP